MRRRFRALQFRYGEPSYTQSLVEEEQSVMVNSAQERVWRVRIGQGVAAFALTLPLLFTLDAIEPAQAQTFQVIHNFTGLGDGSEPTYGLTIDGEGNLYGTTFSGDALTGTAYKLANKGSNWLLSSLHNFPYQGSGGSIPYTAMIQGRDGSLYGTAGYGGKLPARPRGSRSGWG